MKYLVLYLLLFSCATTGKYENILSTWVGQNKDHLIEKWGSPTNVHTLSNNSKILEYKKLDSTRVICNISFTGSCDNGFKVVESYCDTRFTVNVNDVITSWNWSGNACYSK